jgi:2-pyrone-4,6-dicarboxylate lactonase
MTQHTADTPADPPYWLATPSKPKLTLPASGCDAHVHVFGPRARFPFAEGRRYTPSDAPKELLFKLHERLGIQHCVIVQPACHGEDNSVTVDAIAATGGSYKGIALVPLSVSDAELKRLNAAGLCGARFHYMTHLAQGPKINDVIAFAKRLAAIGWHLQIHMEADLIAELTPALRQSPVPVVIDHMGRINASFGFDQPAFKALLSLLNDTNIWVKVSGADRVTRKGPPIPTPCRLRASWWRNSATAASGAPTGHIPTTRGRAPMTGPWSIFSARSRRARRHATQCWSTILIASIVSLRRAN